jgi:predicted regulator of Ras-like GTPase activity (Roadblock/LC7/MglB family)
LLAENSSKREEKPIPPNMVEIAELLSNLTKVDGVKASALIGKDGFVIEQKMRDGVSIDMETVGAIVIGGLHSSEAIGAELNVGKVEQSMVEYENGIIFSKLLPEGNVILTVIADQSAMLGNIRYQVAKLAPELQKQL